VAVRGAIRCDIETSLSEEQVVNVFNDTLGKRRWAKELLSNPSSWKLVAAPPGARTAAEWIRNKREERVHAMKPGGFQDSVTSIHLGTTIALGFNSRTDGRTRAQLFTSVIPMDKGNSVTAMTVRHQMKRVASAVQKQDPSAQVAHHEDTP
jgi:hypothetical protein